MKKYLTFELGAVAIFVVAAIVLGFSLPVNKADANQSEFCGPVQLNGSATTSVSYITAGTATSTLTVSNCSDGSTAIDSAFLTWQVTSSSTPPTLAYRVEVSRDQVDWYPYPLVASTATTSIMVAGVTDYRVPSIASSTDMAGSGVASTTAGTPTNLVGARWYGSLVIPGTPYPYMRVKFYVPAGGAAIGLSAELLAKREKLAR